MIRINWPLDMQNSRNITETHGHEILLCIHFALGKASRGSTRTTYNKTTRKLFSYSFL